MIKNYYDGGCKIVHLDSFIKSLKLSWIKKTFFSNNYGASWKSLFYTTYKTDDNKLISMGNMYATTLIKSFKNNFWNDTLLAYREFQSKVKSENINDILALPLWYNDMILIDNKLIFF